MTYAALFILAITSTRPQDSDETRRAIEIVKKSDGKVFFDDKAPGKPVIGVNL